MKKPILLFIALLFLVVSADANYYGVIARKNYVPPTCVGDKGFNVVITPVGEGGDGYGESTNLFSTKFTHSGATCTVNYIEIYSDDVSAGAFKAGIYDNSGADPNNRLAQLVTPATPPAGAAWAGGALDTVVTLTNGSTYWLAFQADATIGYYYDAITGGDSVYCAGACTYAASMADPYPASTDYDRGFAIRVSNQ